jgi:endonuclease YncB( thermonuclease family)
MTQFSRPSTRNMLRQTLKRLVAASLLAIMSTLAPASQSAFITEAHAATVVHLVRFTICRGSHRINCVVDGDTIWLNARKIRIADINTPEKSQPQCVYEKQLAERATRRLLDLLNQGRVEWRSSGKRDQDRYGRELRLILVNGRSVGDILVAEGLAERWTGRRRNWC